MPILARKPAIILTARSRTPSSLRGNTGIVPTPLLSFPISGQRFLYKLPNPLIHNHLQTAFDAQRRSFAAFQRIPLINGTLLLINIIYLLINEFILLLNEFFRLISGNFLLINIHFPLTCKDLLLINITLPLINRILPLTSNFSSLTSVSILLTYSPRMPAAPSYGNVQTLAGAMEKRPDTLAARGGAWRPALAQAIGPPLQRLG